MAVEQSYFGPLYFGVPFTNWLSITLQLSSFLQHIDLSFIRHAPPPFLFFSYLVAQITLPTEPYFDSLTTLNSAYFALVTHYALMLSVPHESSVNPAPVTTFAPAPVEQNCSVSFAVGRSGLRTGKCCSIVVVVARRYLEWAIANS